MTHPFFSDEFHFSELESTSTEAKTYQHISSPFIVTAEKQTAGRGRLGNIWESKQGEFTCSLGLRRNDIAFDATLLPLMFGIIVSGFISSISNVRSKLKWPNDVFSPKGKISGILVEHVDGLYVVGIGINVCLTDADFAAFGLSGASLKTETGQTFSQKSLYASFKKYCGELLQQRWTEDRIIEEWLKRCMHHNEILTCRVGSTIREGYFRGLGTQGQLLLEVQGKVEKIWAGEIIQNG